MKAEIPFGQGPKYTKGSKVADTVAITLKKADGARLRETCSFSTWDFILFYYSQYNSVAPAVLCTPQTSIWKISNYPVPGNTVTFQFQRRTNCRHYFRISSPCTSFEVAYTTTHDLASAPPYTINSVSQPWVNLVGCPSPIAAILEGNIVNAFNPPPKSEWYRIFLAPAPLGGYVATWTSGPQKVWFSWSIYPPN